jgi:hypothetical protein
MEFKKIDIKDAEDLDNFKIDRATLNDSNHSNQIYISKGLRQIRTEDILSVCKRIITENDSLYPFFMIIDNVEGELTPIEPTPPTATPFQLCGIEESTRNVVFFPDKPRERFSSVKVLYAHSVKCNVFVKNIPTSIVAECIFIVDDASAFVSKLQYGMKYNFTAMQLMGRGQKMVLRSSAGTVEHYYIITDFSMVKDDFSGLEDAMQYIKSCHDLALLIDFGKEDIDKEINGKIVNESNPWNEIETNIYLKSIFYCERGRTMYNLVICAPQSTKKTGLLFAISEVFNTKFLDSSQIRGLGLKPSFYNGGFNPGALVGANFVAPMDEFLRKFILDSDSTHIGAILSLRKGLSSLFPIFEKKKFSPHVGVGNQTVTMDNSMIFTDNNIYENMLMILNNKDPPLLKRLTFLKLSEQSIINSRRIDTDITEDEIVQKLCIRLARRKLNFSLYRLLFKYMRNECHNGQFVYDRNRCLKIARMYVTAAGNRSKISSSIIFDYKNKLHDIMKATIVLNWVYGSDHLCKSNKYVATEKDYEDFENEISYLVDSHYKILSGEFMNENQKYLEIDLEEEKKIFGDNGILKDDGILKENIIDEISQNIKNEEDMDRISGIQRHKFDDDNSGGNKSNLQKMVEKQMQLSEEYERKNKNS